MIIQSFVIYGLPDMKTAEEVSDALGDWINELSDKNGLNLKTMFLTQDNEEEEREKWAEFEKYLNNK